MLNWALIKNPLNWLTVILMVVIAGYAIDVVSTYVAKGATETGD